MKKRISLLLALLFAAIFLTDATALAAESGGVFRLPITEPETLDPAQLSWDFEYGIGSQMMEGLTGLDQNLNVVPAIASAWTSPDAKTWTFNLRHDVYFHNGRQVIAKDFVNSWNRAKNAGGPYAGVFNNIASFSASGNSPLSSSSQTQTRVFQVKPQRQFFGSFPKKRQAALPPIPLARVRSTL